MGMNGYNSEKALKARNVLSKTVISGVVALSVTAFWTPSESAETPVSKVVAAEIQNDAGPELLEPVMVSNQNKTITFTFAEPISHNKRSDSEFKRQVRFAANGTSYRSLGSRDTVEISDNKLVITFSTSITGNKNTVRIAKNSLEDSSNNANSTDLITSSIQALDIVAPIYQKHTISSDNTEITLTFNEDIQSNVLDLKAGIRLAADGKEFAPLKEEDTVEISGTGNELIINIAQGLRGSKNVIEVLEGTLKDSADNPLSKPVMTKTVQARDIYAPEYQYSDIKNLNKTVTLFFDENIASTVSSTELKNSIRISNDGGADTDLSNKDRVSIRNNTLVIDFASALTGTSELKIAGDVLSDRAKNVISEPIITGIAAADIEAPQYLQSTVTGENKIVTLIFSENITTSKSSSSLKAAVKLATDGRVFKSLTKNDVVYIEENKLVIELSESLLGDQNEVKVSSRILEDWFGNLIGTEIKTENLHVIELPDTTAPVVSNISIKDKNNRKIQGVVTGNTITLNGVQANAQYVTGTLTLSEESVTVERSGFSVTVPPGFNLINLAQLFVGGNGSVEGRLLLKLDGQSFTLKDASGNATPYTLKINE